MNYFVKNALALLGFLLLALVVMALGGYWTSLTVGNWYVELIKPSWNPPSWLFGPVWTFLYFLMSIAAWQIWLRHTGYRVGRALFAYYVQLALNLSWSGLFFALKSPTLGLINIVLLVLAILWTIREFKKVRRGAAFLLYPYLAWVMFATVLNGAIVVLNG